MGYPLIVVNVRKRTPAKPLPPPPSSDENGGGSNWELLVVAPNHITAHLMEGMLKDSGIEVRLDTTNLSPGAFLTPFGDSRAPVKVYVRAYDVVEASQLISKAEETKVDQELGDKAPPRSLAALIILVVVGLLLLIEIFDFAPCVIGVFCF